MVQQLPRRPRASPQRSPPGRASPRIRHVAHHDEAVRDDQRAEPGSLDGLGVVISAFFDKGGHDLCPGPQPARRTDLTKLSIQQFCDLDGGPSNRRSQQRALQGNDVLDVTDVHRPHPAEDRLVPPRSVHPATIMPRTRPVGACPAGEGTSRGRPLPRAGRASCCASTRPVTHREQRSDAGGPPHADAWTSMRNLDAASSADSVTR